MATQIKSIEQMAKAAIEAYMRPLVLNGHTVHDGWPVHIAAKKAAAAHHTYKDTIHRVALKMQRANA